MSILRNAFDQNIVDQEQANFLQEQADAQGMGAIRRGWNAGRAGGDLNAARIDEAAALAAGDAQKAALLGQQREYLERRQALYAPEVGKVEDIRGLGDALSWAGTQVGQSAASTVEPAALGAAGTALGKLPGAFKLAPLAAGIGSFALNQRQMAGEHVGRLREDPAAMASLGAKGVYDQANLVGAAGGALETVFPFAVGRALGGAALRQGAGGLMGRSFGAKTLGGMAMGGGTEVAQGEIGRFMHTDANPLRKTEGDWSDRLNELAGGLVGDAPFSAAGAAADMAYGGTARAGDVVKEKAGEVVDMAADAAGKAKQAYKDSGLKGAMDLGVEGTKSVFEKTKEYVGDQVNHDAAIMRAVADVERYTMTPQEFALLTEAPPPPDLPPDQQRAWTDEMFGKRQAHLFEKMLSLEEQGVPEATQFVDRMTSDDPLEATKAVYDATDFLFERHAAAAAQQRSAVLKAMSGGLIQRAAKKMTRGAKVVGGAAAFAGLNVAEGVRQGLGKKNKQGVAEEGDHSSPRQLDYETWKRMREAGGVGAGQGELFGRPSAARVEFTADEQKHAIARANKLFERGDEKPIKTDPVAAARSLERATLFAEIMAAEARARKQRVVAHRVEQDGDGDAIGIENFARYVAYEIADMAESWSGRAGQTAHPTAKDGGQAKVAVSLLDSMADDIVGLVGSAAGGDAVSRMAQQGAPESQPFFELLQERVTNWRGNAAERAAREQTARDQMVALLPQQFQADLLADDGIGARKMYETIGAIARGLITPQKRKEIEQYIPRETLNQMLTLYGATVPDRGGSAESGWMAGDDSEAFDPDRLSMNDDGDVVEGASDFEKNMGEKALSRGGVGQKRYGHSKSPAMRESPFAPAKRMSKEEYIAFRELERERRMAGEPADVYPEVERPRLFTKGQKYSDGRDAIEARVEAMSEKLGPDFSVTARSAQDVMDASNMHAASRLAIFRDYMFAASRDTSLPVEAQLTAKNRAHLARKALLDALDDPGTLEGLRRNKVGDANMTEEQKSASGFGTPGVVEQWVEELLKDYEKAGGVRQNKKVEDTPPPRLTPGERKILYAGMENYFRSRYIVEAERQIDRESSRIDAVEIRKMIEKGRGTYDVLKRDYGDGTAEMKAAMADSNLLWFKSTLHDERTGKPDEVPISANTLVGWVRKQRSLSEEYSGNDERLSNRDKNDAFLSDLYEGISILMNSGFMTDDLPYLKGPDGKPQTFEDATITAKNKKLGVVTGRIPANLQLETTTGSGYMFARDERVRGVPKKRHERTKEEDSDDARDDERYQKARDWELARGDDLDDGGGNEATQIEVGEGERETLNPYGDIKRKVLKASSAAYEKRFGVEQQMRELGLALQKAQEKGSAVQIAALARRINELAVVADGLPTEPPDTIEEIESRLEATRAELIAAMAAGGGDAKRIAKLGEEAAVKKRWVAPMEIRGQATAASVMKQRVASLEDQRREERAPGEKISTLKRRLFELTALLDTELNKEHEKAPPGTPGAPKRARVKSLAKETLNAGDRGKIGAAYAQGKRAAAMREEERQSAAPRTETPEERMAREAGLLGWLDDTGARENETPAQRQARLQKARKSALLGEASGQGGKRAHSVELERQDTQRAAGLRNNRIDRWRVDRDVEEHVLAAAKRAADDEGLKFGSTEYREFMRNYTERRVTERSRDSEQVTAEKVDLSMRSKMVGAGIGPEPKHSARNLAEDRAGAVLETFRRHGVVKGMEVLESRLRTAKATNTDGGAGTVGGAHYAWPLAHILNKRQIEGMDLAATDPQDLKILRRLLAMRSELAKVIHDSASLRLADKVDMVKAMASAEGAERVTAATVMKMLAGAAQPARDAEAVAQEAAREQAAKIAAKKAARGVAAAEAPKSQPPQGGAGKTGRDLGPLPMYYKMPAQAVRPELRTQYPNGTTTAQLMADGHRTATTRRAFGKVGDTFSVDGIEYRITALETVDLDTAAGRAKWSRREGWDVDYVQRKLSGQVHTGAVQTVFERVVPGARRGAVRALGAGQAGRADADVAAEVGVGARRDGRNARDDGPIVPGRQAESKAERKVGFTLTGKTIHTPKDQAKASRANVFIGRGVDGSSTALYAVAAKRQGIPVNPGKYSASDKVFVSVNGNRSDRVRPDFDEIGRAVQAGATIITDDKENRARGFNVGEREVAEFLTKQGYEERAPGEWGRKGMLYPSRSLVRQENRAAVKASPDKAVFLKAANAVQRTVRSLYALGTPREDVLHHKLVMKQMQPIMQGILKGDPAASVLRDSLLSDIDMTYALPFDAVLNESLRAQLKAPTTLGDMMAAFESSSVPDHFKAIAKAVRKVAGRTPTLAPGDGDMSDDYNGAFDPTSGTVFVRPDSHTVASTALHEGVHAATVRAVNRDAALRQAVSDLLDHVVEHNPRLLGAYGTTNTLEFLAEGLSNRGLQRALYKIPASPKVAKYLGETLANAWDSFVALVRQAMNLDPKHTSALTQLLELSGRAMKSVGLDGAVADGMSQEERVEVLKRIQASPEKLREAYREVLESPAWGEGVTKDARKALLKEMTMPDGGTTMSHTGGYVLAEIRGMMRAATPGSMAAQTLRAAVEREISQLFSRDGGAGLIPSRRKLNAQGTAKTGQEKLIDEYINSPAGADMAFEVNDEYSRAEVREMFESGALADTALGKKWAALKSAPRDTTPTDEELLSGGVEPEGSERSLTDVEDIEYRDVAAEDAGLLGAEPPDGGQKPPEDAQEPPKSAPRALVVAREGQGAKKARKRAQRTVPTGEDIQAAKDYLRRVLGDQIRTRFGEITGYSGQWIEDENVIEVSTLTLAGALNVARHEALHAFWSKFVQADPQAIKVLSSLTNDPRILRRLETLLADDPHALEQLADGEERLTYIYQFAMAGQLKLPHTPGTTLMSRIRKFLRQVFMMVRDDERAVDLLYAFEAGQMSKPDAAAKAIAKVINQGTWARKAARGMDGVVQGAAALVLPASTILATSSSRTAREVGKMFFTNPGEEGSAEGGTGYLNARNQKMRAYNNLFRAAVEDLDDRQLKELTEVMQNETPLEDINDPDVAQAKEKLHQMFARFHKYLTEERGLRMGEIRENYFPVVYDPDKVREGLRDMLTSPKYIGEMNKMVAAINKNIAKGNAFLEKQGALEETRDPVTLEEVLDGIVNHITRDNPTDDIEMEPKRHDGVLRPWFAGGERRVLFFLDPEDRAKFQEKDIILTATRYLRQGVRAAEYSSRFGRDGRLLAQKVMVGGEMTEIGMLPNIRGELYEESHDMLKRGELKDEKARKKWVDRQYRDVARAIGAMEGSLGHDVSELVRNVNAASIVYQNIRLLPLALFSSFVDPLGIIAGGGTMSQAWDTFGRGIRGVIRQWGDMVREQPPERAKDEWEKLAELAGVVDSATFSHLLTDEYGSVYLGSKASKANELMFKANGMEAWNRGMRVGATKAAVAFMERHNKGGDKHSERWLRDLGFEVGGLKLGSDGRMITGKRDLMAANPGMSLDEAEAYIDKVHAAINRWVESTILSPNAAQRPAWGSDPHYGMFWHLKQFAYSFHQTIMKRAINEAGHGNYAPLGVFAWYIPAMIVSDVVKGLALGAGELPAHMKGYNLGDWMMHGVRRAGILGIGDIGIEGLKDPTGLAGPSVEQATDLFFKPLEENLVRALPANALYSRAIL